MKLPAPDHWTWLGLRRVNCHTVTRFQGTFHDGGHPFSGCLYPILIEALLERELLTLADPDTDGRQRLVLSDAGRAEYRTLCRRLRHKDVSEQVSAAEHGSSEAEVAQVLPANLD